MIRSDVTRGDMTPLTGVDKYGDFVVRLGVGHCDHCGRSVAVRIGYVIGKMKLPPGKHPERTLLGSLNSGGWVGVTCGCYAKAHRQMAHIGSKGEKCHVSS